MQNLIGGAPGALLPFICYSPDVAAVARLTKFYIKRYISLCYQKGGGKLIN